MPRFNIVKRDRPDVFLWALPNKERVWATDEEFKRFCDEIPLGVMTEVPNSIRPQFVKGGELLKMSTKQHSGDFIANYISEFGESVAVVKADIGMTDQEEARIDRREKLLVGLMLMALGGGLALWFRG